MNALPMFEFPPLYSAADQEAINKQRRHLLLRRTEILALVASACLSQVPWRVFEVNASAIGSGVLFSMAVGCQVATMTHQYEKRWYDARALAESLKSSSWQYAVGGEAFPMIDESAREQFIHVQQELLKSLGHLSIPSGFDKYGVPDSIDQTRETTLDGRKQLYLTHRVKDQLGWYSSNASRNQTRATGWSIGLVVLYGAAVVLSLWAGFLDLSFDWVLIASTAGAGALAWTQTKQYSSIAQAYAVTSHDVVLVADRLRRADSEAEWATAVHDAEAAFSREHTMWLARRQRT